MKDWINSWAKSAACVSTPGTWPLDSYFSCLMMETLVMPQNTFCFEKEKHRKKFRSFVFFLGGKKSHLILAIVHKMINLFLSSCVCFLETCFACC